MTDHYIVFVHKPSGCGCKEPDREFKAAFNTLDNAMWYAEENGCDQVSEYNGEVCTNTYYVGVKNG